MCKKEQKNERVKLLELANLRKKIVKAKGSYVFSDDGERYLDFTSQYGVHLFGHNPDFLYESIYDFWKENLPNMIQPFENKGAKNLTKLLIKLSPGDMQHVVFTNSGAESVEAAIKMVRAISDRKGILSTKNSYHGKTLGALMATGNSRYRDAFHPTDNYFDAVPFGDISTLSAALSTKKHAAFIVEPIQGEGGVNVPPDNYLKECERLYKEHGVLFIVDEIQTGLGRTGYLFCCEKYKVEPDILLLSKSLGGGIFPIGACVTNDKAWSKKFGMLHSSTFAGNQLSCVVALRVLKALTKNDDIFNNVRENGNFLSEKLNQLKEKYPSVVQDVSGLGFMQGIKIKPWLDEDSYFIPGASYLGLAIPIISSYLLNVHNIFTLPTLTENNTLRIQPNLLMNKNEIYSLVKSLDDVFSIISKGDYYRLFNTLTGIGSNNENKISKDINQNGNPALIKNTNKLGTFAFLIHPTELDDLITGSPSGNFINKKYDKERVSSWYENLKSMYGLSAFPAYYLPRCESKSGGYVDGWLITSLLTPRELMRLPKNKKQELLSDYIECAKSVGADIVGLGAFTSVISRSGHLVKDKGIHITTGNSYTALVCTETIKKLSKDLGRAINKAKVAVVGAKGSVGRLISLDIAHDAGELVLVGNPKNPRSIEDLKVVAGEICIHLLKSDKSINSPLREKLDYANICMDDISVDFTGEDNTLDYRKIFNWISQAYKDSTGLEFPIFLSTSIEVSLPECEIVFTATSEGKEFIKPHYLKKNSIICDASRPSDLSKNIAQARKDIFVFEGGLVKFHEDVRFGRPNILGFKSGINLACLAETITLSMSNPVKNYSIEGTSPLDEAKQIFKKAHKHGFKPFCPIDIFIEEENDTFIENVYV